MVFSGLIRQGSARDYIGGYIEQRRLTYICSFNSLQNLQGDVRDPRAITMLFCVFYVLPRDNLSLTAYSSRTTYNVAKILS